MSTLKVTCAEKYVLIDQTFQFDFPVQYGFVAQRFEMQSAPNWVKFKA